jgi:uncharacterized zinc-type alcohol dehydrogenase-like protein
MTETPAYAAFDSHSPLRPHRIVRREVSDHDVQIEILYCGICHSDLHQARNDWHSSMYPMVPGHEIVGRVTAVGSKVVRFKPGQRVGVGVMVGTCRSCSACRSGHESYCTGSISWTYNSFERDNVTPTYGGYSGSIVTDEHFVVRLPDALPLERVAPLLCAGITTYSPLKHWKAGPGKRVGVVGLGGLGHVAVKLAAAMGAEVTVLSTSEKKRPEAKRLGAHDFLLTEQATAVAKERFDLILDTVSAPHSYDPLLSSLAFEGTLVLLGMPEKGKEAPLDAGKLIERRRSVAGSIIGGLAETQAMLDFCEQHAVGAEVEVIAASQINEAYERLLRGDVRYRFVLDAKTLV